MSLFSAPVKSEKQRALERKATIARLVEECAPDVTWVVSFSKLRAYVQDFHADLGMVQPMIMSIHERPGAGSKLRCLWSAVSSHPDMLFPFELVREEVEGQAEKYGHFPGVLELGQACYVAAFARAYPGVLVRAAAQALPVELRDELAKGEVEARRAQPMPRGQPTLQASSPALRPCHMAALVSATNALTACAPWDHGVLESQVFRVRFPGAASPAPGYSLPPGEVYWVNVIGQRFCAEMQAVMQRARAEGKNVNIKVDNPHTLFGAFVFRRRCDAEARVMQASAGELMRSLEKGVAPRYPFHPSELPLPAVANEADKLCTVCGKAGATACAVCGEVSYCAERLEEGSSSSSSSSGSSSGGCAAQHRAAHELVCCPKPKKRLGMVPDVLSHMARPVLHCMFTHHTHLPAEDADLVEAGGCPVVGRIEPMFRCGEAPHAMMHDGKGSASRPPLLELTRLTRALAAVAAFCKEQRWLASAFVPMQQELAVVLPGLEGQGEDCGPGVGGMGGVAYVRTDPLFCQGEREARQNTVAASLGNIGKVWAAQMGGLEGVNTLQARRDVEVRRAAAVRQQQLKEGGGGDGGGHGHSH